MRENVKYMLTVVAGRIKACYTCLDNLDFIQVVLSTK
jgi:hypothetical protein